MVIVCTFLSPFYTRARFSIAQEHEVLVLTPNVGDSYTMVLQRTKDPLSKISLFKPAPLCPARIPSAWSWFSMLDKLLWKGAVYSGNIQYTNSSTLTAGSTDLRPVDTRRRLNYRGPYSTIFSAETRMVLILSHLGQGSKLVVGHGGVGGKGGGGDPWTRGVQLRNLPGAPAS